MSAARQLGFIAALGATALVVDAGLATGTGCACAQEGELESEIDVDACLKPEATAGHVLARSDDCAVALGDVEMFAHNERTITISNPTAANLDLRRVGIIGDPAWALVGDVPDLVPSRGSVPVVVDVRPTVAAEAHATLTIVSDAANAARNDDGTTSVNVALTATGVNHGVPNLTVDADCDFGTVAVDASASCTITLGNDGSSDVIVDDVSFGPSTDAAPGFTVPDGSTTTAPFSMTSRPFAPAEPVAPGATATIDVVFAPDVVGHYAGTLRISSNDPDASIHDVPLRGDGA